MIKRVRQKWGEQKTKEKERRHFCSSFVSSEIWEIWSTSDDFSSSSWFLSFLLVQLRTPLIVTLPDHILPFLKTSVPERHQELKERQQEIWRKWRWIGCINSTIITILEDWFPSRSLSSYRLTNLWIIVLRNEANDEIYLVLTIFHFQLTWKTWYTNLQKISLHGKINWKKWKWE